MSRSLGALATFTLLRLMRRRRIYASRAALLEGVAQTRRAGPAAPPSGLADVSVTMGTRDGCPVYVLRPARREVQVQVLYLHGGAYCRPITRFHWHLLIDLARRANAEILVPLYPLAPEACGLSALHFVSGLHTEWASRAAAPTVLMGDSAGGGLALALAVACRDEGRVAAERLMLITPWVDVAVPSAKAQRIEASDPMLALDGVRAAGELYAGELGVAHPSISPARADLRGLPSMTMYVGGCDVLGPDAIEMAAQARSAGVVVDLQVQPDMMHVWPLLGFREARDARSHMVATLRNLSA
ncbi:alpha/beta hydrolase fold domain-containing protein [Aquabacterium sp.]|uniref:alpha/beta hydrolase fold domain-containing protein n=1 Tax=Aquabacterium sp. TaxID=1872578 RepID=UPI0035B174BA